MIFLFALLLVTAYLLLVTEMLRIFDAVLIVPLFGTITILGMIACDIAYTRALTHNAPGQVAVFSFGVLTCIVGMFVLTWGQQNQSYAHRAQNQFALNSHSWSEMEMVTPGWCRCKCRFSDGIMELLLRFRFWETTPTENQESGVFSSKPLNTWECGGETAHVTEAYEEVNTPSDREERRGSQDWMGVERSDESETDGAFEEDVKLDPMTEHHGLIANSRGPPIMYSGASETPLAKSEYVPDASLL